jgi:hypothetical protein
LKQVGQFDGQAQPGCLKKFQEIDPQSTLCDELDLRGIYRE